MESWCIAWCACLLPSFTIRYDSVYLTCSKKLTGSQLTTRNKQNIKYESETKKMMSVIGPVQSHYREAASLQSLVLITPTHEGIAKLSSF